MPLLSSSLCPGSFLDIATFGFICVLVLAADTAIAGEVLQTEDDNSPMIQWSADTGWTQSAESDLDYGGFHQLSEDPTAWAEFSFTGHAVGYVAPKWPYSVHSAISLDGAPATVVAMIDQSSATVIGDDVPETVASDTIWSADNLNEGPHTVKVSMAPAPDQDFVIVDAFWFKYNSPDPVTTVQTTTALLTTTTTSTTSSTQTQSPNLAGTSTFSSSSAYSSSSSATPTSDPKPAKPNVGAIAGGAAGGLVGLIGMIAIFALIRRRNRSGPVATSTSESDNDGGGQPGSGWTSVPPQMVYYSSGPAPSRPNSGYTGLPIVDESPWTPPPLNQQIPASYSYVGQQYSGLAGPEAGTAAAAMYVRGSGSNPQGSSNPETPAVDVARFSGGGASGFPTSPSPSSSIRDLGARPDSAGFDSNRHDSASQKDIAQAHQTGSAVPKTSNSRAGMWEDGLPVYSVDGPDAGTSLGR